MVQKEKKLLKNNKTSLVKKDSQVFKNKGPEPRDRSFRLRNKYSVEPTAIKLSSSWKLLKQAVHFYKTHWRIFLGLTLIYVAVLWTIVGLPSQQTYGEYKGILATAFGGNLNNVAGIGTLIAGALSGAVAPEQSELQQFLRVLAGSLFWLVFVWVARHLIAGNKVTIRQALYNAPAPLIALLTLTVIVTLQLMPAAIGVLVLSYTVGGGVTVISGVEAMLFAIGATLLILLSTYMVIQSLFALIIVTLPNMYPLAALSTAKSLVNGRRLLILRRLLAFILMLLLIWLTILVPFILLDTSINSDIIPVVPLTLDLLSAFSLPIAIIYLYRLYRELL